MTPEKILSVVSVYKERFVREGINAKRMNPGKTFEELGKQEILSHAHYLVDSVMELATNPEKVGKTGRHLGSLQTCLSFAGWYTLEELMNHNRP